MTNNNLEEKIKTILEEEINPALSMHNGSASLVSIEDTDDLLFVKIKFQGSCVGCEGTRGGTLHSIQNYLKDELQIDSLMVVPTD